MTCRQFERDGLARAEAGLPDPHTDDCADCQAARAEYERLRAAIADTGAAYVPRAGWEARVLAELDRGATASKPSRAPWLIGGAALAAAAALILWWQLGRSRATDDARVAQIETVRGSQIVRGAAPAVGDGLRVRYDGDRAAIWIYRNDRRVLACSRIEDPRTSGTPDGTCTLTARRVLADLDGLTAATYVVVTAQTDMRAPDTLDLAIASLTRADARPMQRELVVE